MNKTDLIALAERVAGLPGPSREVDGWIHAQMTRGQPYIIGHKPGRFPQEPIYGGRIDVMYHLTNDPEGAAEYIDAPRFTASLDAAMQLVPAGWSKWLFDADNGDCICKLETDDRGVSARAKTWPLALTAAALRALAEAE